MDPDPETAELLRSLPERELCCVEPYTNPDDPDDDEADFLRADFVFSSTDGNRTKLALASVGGLGASGGGVGNLFTSSPSSSSSVE